MKNICCILFLLLTVYSCKNEDQVETEISKIDVNLMVERFDRAFSEARPQDLEQLKKAFPFMFSKYVPDSVFIARMKDTLQNELLNEVHEKFNDFSTIESELTGLFQHLKYYDLTFSEPRVITLTNDVKYRDKVIVTDTIVLIPLDNYLGSEHEYYANIPKYITQNMKPSQIVSNLTSDYAERYIFQPQKKTLLDDMVYFGKQLYFKDKMIPFKTDEEKIGYTQLQLEFAKNNEGEIWTNFIENEYVFSTDNTLPSRFIADAPFSKFYLQLDRESPGRLGQYIGWQIVRAYMNNNNVPFLDMLKKDAVEIFNNSNYKPPK
ncbi:gliding motility lipoprotein GldB [Psychroserpens ponticola]|uniref:Gliding motility lipoprotein GldB n=1 Tax=Psychroserpens ponticola TaxID=2932268 RepID=A0ABY7S2N5_9FLAO|nr:gliding motility lipoprotein GldB [Psychroserpens ponticola]WCO02175.1 gliding motility lipoprotein GldB [Psychroserpens ponticola]